MLALVLLCVWSLLHSLFMRGRFVPGAPLSAAFSRRTHWWLAAVIAGSLALVAVCVIHGEFWNVVPAALWLYFYLSLLAGRNAAWLACDMSAGPRKR